MRGYIATTVLLRQKHMARDTKTINAAIATFDKEKVPCVKRRADRMRLWKKDAAEQAIPALIEELKKHSSKPGLIGKAKSKRITNGLPTITARVPTVTVTSEKGVLLTVQYGTNKSVTVTLEEGRQIHGWLDTIFGSDA